MSAQGRLVIVAGVQFDATADAVWDKAQTLLGSRPDARLHLCHVVVSAAAIKAEASDKLPSLVDEGLARLHEWVAKKAGGADNPICTQIHLDVALGVPADEIVQSAVNAEADLILLGTHGRKAVARLVLGSVAEAVLHKAPCSVLIARASEYGELTKSPSLAPAPEASHKPYRPHPSSVRSSIVFSSYDSAIYPTGASRKSIH